MNVNDMEVVRFQESNALHTVRRVHKNSPPVRMSVSLCDPRDRNMKECLWLANHCCEVAFKATEVARGRLGPRSLVREMTSRTIEQILNINVVLEQCQLQSGKPSSLFAKNLPIQIRGLQGTVLRPNSFDACVAMRIGRENHCANVILTLLGSRWICTGLQLS